MVQLLWAQGAEDQWLVPVEQLGAAVEVDAHENLILGSGQRLVVLENLVVAVFVTDAPVVLDYPVFLEAENAV